MPGPTQNQPTPEQPRLHPGDDAPQGTPGTGEDLCPTCGGSGKRAGKACETCDGTGVVTHGIGGA